jgi:hypothetical protein
MEMPAKPFVVVNLCCVIYLAFLTFDEWVAGRGVLFYLALMVSLLVTVYHGCHGIRPGICSLLARLLNFAVLFGLGGAFYLMVLSRRTSLVVTFVWCALFLLALCNFASLFSQPEREIADESDS